MRVSGIADKSRPDYWPRRIKAIEDAVASLRTARTLEAASIGAGGLTVVDEGAITFAPAAGAQPITMRHHLSDDDTAGLIEWSTPAHPTAPAQIRGYDGTNDYCGIEILSPDADGDGVDDAQLSVAPYDGVSMQHGFPFAGEANASLKVHRYTLNGNKIAAVEIQVVNDVGGGGAWSFSTSPSGLNGPNGCTWQAPASAVEWRAVASDGSGYVPVRASSFPTGSSREIKEAIEAVPFDSVEAISAAPALQWQYREGYAHEPGVRHIGPMAEDLPADLVIETDGVKGVDLLSLVGTLWDAVGKLSARVAALEQSLPPK